MKAEKAPVGYTNGTSFNWNTRGQTIAAATVLPALGLICVGLRFWSRLHRRTGFGLDDAFIFPALLCVIGLGITLLVGVSNNVIAHTTPPNPNAGNKEAQLYQITPQQSLVEKIEFVFFLVSVVAYGFIKLSIIFFYRRIFVKGTSSRFDVVTKAAIGITTAWTIAFFLVQLFKCGKNIDSAWGPLIDSTRCLNSYKYTDALFVSDLLTDLLVICLPIPIILRLHLITSRKLAIIGVLLLGTMSIVASIVRVVYGFQIEHAGRAKPTDVDEGLTTLLYWGMLEAGISLIATNLPSLHFLVTKKSLHSLAASIRSAVSLTSLQSRGSKNGNDARSPYSKMPKDGSIASNVPVIRDDREKGEAEVGVDTFAMYDIEHAADIRAPGVVHVKSEIGQEGDMV